MLIFHQSHPVSFPFHSRISSLWNHPWKLSSRTEWITRLHSRLVIQSSRWLCWTSSPDQLCQFCIHPPLFFLCHQMANIEKNWFFWFIGRSALDECSSLIDGWLEQKLPQWIYACGFECVCIWWGWNFH